MPERGKLKFEHNMALCVLSLGASAVRSRDRNFGGLKSFQSGQISTGISR